MNSKKYLSGNNIPNCFSKTTFLNKNRYLIMNNSMIIVTKYSIENIFKYFTLFNCSCLLRNLKKKVEKIKNKKKLDPLVQSTNSIVSFNL